MKQYEMWIGGKWVDAESGKTYPVFKDREHRAIAGDQAFRLACYYIARDVQSGLYDPELLKTLGEEWDEFKKRYPVLGKKELPKQPDEK